MRALVLAVGLALASPAIAAPAIVLKLDAATQQRLGVVTARLAARQRAASVSGFARVLDPVPLATLDSDIAAAAAALAASQAEATRSRALNAADQTVSKKVAEAAAAQARADAAKLQLLRRRVGLEWGPGLATLSDAQRGRLVADMAAGRAALVRIDATAGVNPARGSATLDLGPSGRAIATILGPTRSGDPRLQSTGLLGLVRGPAALQLGAGTVAPATIAAGAATSGVVIPRAALLRTAGQTYAYVRRDAGSFERRTVVGGQADPAGLFVVGGFRAGEQVVVTGASQLFAAETPAQPGT
jgi:hypothetical protein